MGGDLVVVITISDEFPHVVLGFAKQAVVILVENVFLCFRAGAVVEGAELLFAEARFGAQGQ
jgi:hypothetical protein